MQVPRSIAAISLLGLIVTACGGGPAAATQGPGGGATQAPGDGGGTATQAPVATQGGPGGGGGGGQYGSVKFQLSGAFDKSGELDFVPAGSMFGGAAGTVLNFTDAGDNAQVVSILVDASGKVVVSYAGTDGSMPAAECTTTDWKLEAQSGSGKFDCTAAVSMTASGATAQGGKITGEFTAHT
jgi:hypothetical protein